MGVACMPWFGDTFKPTAFKQLKLCTDFAF